MVSLSKLNGFRKKLVHFIFDFISFYFFMALEVAGGQIDMQKSIFGLIEVLFWCSGGVFYLF